MKITRETVFQSPLMEEWSPNNTIDPNSITMGSCYKALWVCEKCNYEWEAAISNRDRGAGCPYCSGRKLLESRSLYARCKHLLSEWHPTKNSISPEEISYVSCKRAWWICKKCNREWETLISCRTRGTGCPYCAGQRPTTENCLSAIVPELISEWHPKNESTPEDYCPRSSKEVWWLCKEGHEWFASIVSRTGHPRTIHACPYCSGERLVKEKTLKEKFPRLAEEWHVKNILTPDSISYGSKQKVWWICKQCQHEWKTSPNLRTKKLGTGCPKCRKFESKKQKFLLEIVKNLLPDTEILYNYKHPMLKFVNSGRSMELDIYVPNYNLAIEYQGEMHFFPRFGEKVLKDCMRRDAEKRKCCLENGIRLIEIDYTWKGDEKEVINLLGEVG